MNRELGVWTYENSALVLIDYQKEMFEVGGRSQSAHRTAIERLAHAGAVPNTALAVVTELFRDWASPLADKAREVIYWYFGEVTKLKADVGVSEVEKQAARAREQA
ncbi:MAG TPA: hypothetical protein VGX46_02065 [Vicinamibacterales bacterium]|jgi:hypothetical protein|nr:hypothetical protein [Vicinamibacterales bacterium]